MAVLSAILYGSALLIPFFLVPIQYVAVRLSYKDMAACAAVSFVCISSWQCYALESAGGLTLLNGIISCVPALILCLALLCLAAPLYANIPFALKLLVVSFIAALAFMPLMIMFMNDASAVSMFTDAFEKTKLVLGDTGMQVLGDTGMQTETLWRIMRQAVFSTLWPSMFLVLLLGAWLGSKIGLRQNCEDQASCAVPAALNEFRVPHYLVWILLVSWAALLLTVYVKSFVLSAAASNAALVISSCYGIQGLAVMRAFAERAGAATAFKIIVPVLLCGLALLQPLILLVMFGAAVLLGTLETWIPFRTANKGDLP